MVAPTRSDGRGRAPARPGPRGPRQTTVVGVEVEGLGQRTATSSAAVVRPRTSGHEEEGADPCPRTRTQAPTVSHLRLPRRGSREASAAPAVQASSRRSATSSQRWPRTSSGSRSARASSVCPIVRDQQSATPSAPTASSMSSTATSATSARVNDAGELRRNALQAFRRTTKPAAPNRAGGSVRAPEPHCATSAQQPVAHLLVELARRRARRAGRPPGRASPRSAAASEERLVVGITTAAGAVLVVERPDRRASADRAGDGSSESSASAPRSTPLEVLVASGRRQRDPFRRGSHDEAPHRTDRRAGVLDAESADLCRCRRLQQCSRHLVEPAGFERHGAQPPPRPGGARPARAPAPPGR